MSLNWDNYYASGGDFGRLKEEVVDAIVSYVGKHGTRTALDVGCGTGKLARQLAARGFTASGVDPSEEAISRTAKSADIQYLVGDINDVTGDFDLITCKHVYAFIEDKPVFLHDVKFHLKKDGIFILLTPTLDRVIEGKPGIAVDRVVLVRDVTKEFSVLEQRELPGGLLLVCR